MRRASVTDEIIKESITEALFILMKEKPFEDIRVTDIAKKAGVGRVSFYRRYESKEDVLVKYLDDTTDAWCSEFNRSSETDMVLDLFRHAKELEDFINVIYKQNLSHLLLKNVRDSLCPVPEDNELGTYHNACIAGCIYGALEEWIKRGMKDSPEKMSLLLKDVGESFAGEKGCC